MGRISKGVNQKKERIDYSNSLRQIRANAAEFVAEVADVMRMDLGSFEKEAAQVTTRRGASIARVTAFNLIGDAAKDVRVLDSLQRVIENIERRCAREQQEYAFEDAQKILTELEEGILKDQDSVTKSKVEFVRSLYCNHPGFSRIDKKLQHILARRDALRQEHDEEILNMAGSRLRDRVSKDVLNLDQIQEWYAQVLADMKTVWGREQLSKIFKEQADIVLRKEEIKYSKGRSMAYDDLAKLQTITTEAFRIMAAGDPVRYNEGVRYYVRAIQDNFPYELDVDVPDTSVEEQKPKEEVKPIGPDRSKGKGKQAGRSKRK